MKVKDVVGALLECDQEAIVIISIDAEGNSYDPLYLIEKGMNWNERWQEVGYQELTDDMRNRGYGEDDVVEGIPAVVFYP